MLVADNALVIETVQSWLNSPSVTEIWSKKGDKLENERSYALQLYLN